MNIEDLKKENEELKKEIENIKMKYGKHLDNLKNETIKLKFDMKRQCKGFSELMIYLQDPKEYK